MNQSVEARRAGAAAYAGGDLASALSQFQAAVDRRPDDPEAQNGLGQMLVRHGRAEEALPHFDAAVRLDGSKWAYRFNRARAYGLLNRWEEAIADYQAATQLFPEDYATYYNLGLAYLRVSQYSNAVGALERATALAPSEPSFLISLGTAYVGLQQPERARAVFEQFLVQAPEDPEAPRVRALLLALEAAKGTF